MTDRDPLPPILRRQVVDINALYRTLGDSIETTIAMRTRGSAPDRPITSMDQTAIMQHVREGLDVIFGSHRGAQSAVGDIVLRDTQLARFAPLDSAVTAWRVRMTRELQARVEVDANG